MRTRPGPPLGPPSTCHPSYEYGIPPPTHLHLLHIFKGDRCRNNGRGNRAVEVLFFKAVCDFLLHGKMNLGSVGHLHLFTFLKLSTLDEQYNLDRQIRKLSNATQNSYNLIDNSFVLSGIWCRVS